MSNAATILNRPTLSGMRLVAFAAAVSLIICLIDYFTPHGTIAHTYGVMLVIISTALMLWASGWISFGTPPHRVIVMFEVLIVLDILGTGACAYFLEAPFLLFFMVVALVGWIWHLMSDRPRVSAS